MSTDRIAVVEGNLDAFLARATAAPGRLEGDAPLRQEGGPTARQAVRLFEDQVLCRALDVTARRLKRRDLFYYTISSAGHKRGSSPRPRAVSTSRFCSTSVT